MTVRSTAVAPFSTFVAAAVAARTGALRSDAGDAHGGDLAAGDHNR